MLENFSGEATNLAGALWPGFGLFWVLVFVGLGQLLFEALVFVV